MVSIFNARNFALIAATVSLYSLSVAASFAAGRAQQQPHPQRHQQPLRAQVQMQRQNAAGVSPSQALQRDANINQRINNNYGHLSGQYGSLENQNFSIQRQTMRDASRNGGALTTGQNNQINREETNLSRETFFDNTNNQFVKNHPRRAQVLARDSKLGYSINADEGHLGGHYSQLSREDNQIANQEQRDARQNGGYITTQQQGQLNREETALGNQVRYDNTNNSFVQNHPRRAQVLGRDAGIDYRINADEGHLGGHYSQLQHEDNQIANQEQRDARQNGGYITTQQQGQLNREESALSNQVRYDNTNNPFVKNHPGRAEVLSRDSNLNYSINKDEGHLGGQYGNLMQQDRQIAQQEQTDARANGGYLTGQQYQQLNQEESQVRQEIKQDYSRPY